MCRSQNKIRDIFLGHIRNLQMSDWHIAVVVWRICISQTPSIWRMVVVVALLRWFRCFGLRSRARWYVCIVGCHDGSTSRMRRYTRDESISDEVKGGRYAGLCWDDCDEVDPTRRVKMKGVTNRIEDGAILHHDVLIRFLLLLLLGRLFKLNINKWPAAPRETHLDF